MSRKTEKNKRIMKVTVLLLATVMLIGSTIGATLAWLTDKTDKVENTFTTAELFADPDNDFTLWEHEAVDTNEDGCYELNDQKEVQANTYGVLPGVDIPKNPTVDIANLEECGYLYIKVIDNLEDGMSYTVDSNNWTQLEGTTDIWVYVGTNADANKVINASDDSKKSFEVEILTNNKILVSNDYQSTEDGFTLEFEAYMVQATGNGANAKEAWTNTFGNTATP